MDHQLEIPYELFDRLADAAQREGTTPVGWLEQHVPPKAPAPSTEPRTLYDVFKDVIGKYHSGGKERLADRHSEVFGEILEQKRREGRL